MEPGQKIKMVILAAKLAKESLELLTMDSGNLAKLQFRQIVLDLKALDDHIKTL